MCDQGTLRAWPGLLTRFVGDQETQKKFTSSGTASLKHRWADVNWRLRRIVTPVNVVPGNAALELNPHYLVEISMGVRIDTGRDSDEQGMLESWGIALGEPVRKSISILRECFRKGAERHQNKLISSLVLPSLSNKVWQVILLCHSFLLAM